jgi:hypothetical protein
MITVAAPIDADVLRIRHEFISLPDLHTSVEDVAALLSVLSRRATSLLESLVRDRLLQKADRGTYARYLASQTVALPLP